MLAKADDRKALQRRIGIAGGINVGERLIQRPVGKIGQAVYDIGERQLSGKIAYGKRQRQRPLLLPQFLPDIMCVLARAPAIVQGTIEIFRGQQICQLRLDLHRHG